jgi:hypothetical protein
MAEEIKFTAAEKEPYKVIRFDSAGTNGVVFSKDDTSYNGLKLSVNAEKFDDLVEFLEQNEISFHIRKEHLSVDANRSVGFNSYDQKLTSEGMYRVNTQWVDGGNHVVEFLFFYLKGESYCRLHN